VEVSNDKVRKWIFVIDKFRTYEISKQDAKCFDEELQRVETDGSDDDFKNKDWFDEFLKLMKDQKVSTQFNWWG